MIQKVRPVEPLVRVLLQETLEERLEGRRHCVWVLDRVVDDQVDQGIQTVGVEGRCADEELVQNHSQGPQIRCVRVGLLLN